MSANIGSNCRKEKNCATNLCTLIWTKGEDVKEMENIDLTEEHLRVLKLPIEIDERDLRGYGTDDTQLKSLPRADWDGSKGLLLQK